MAKQKLTKTLVERLSSGDADYVVWDVELPGFGVRVKPSGVKSYVVQYRNRKTGASRRKTIGQHGPLLTFHKARERARIILADALIGNDPIAEDRVFGESMRRAVSEFWRAHDPDEIKDAVWERMTPEERHRAELQSYRVH